jgi:hypothetical protein
MFDLFSLVEWPDPELVEAMKVVESGMAARHPELDEPAIKALAWMWGYSAWK